MHRSSRSVLLSSTVGLLAVVSLSGCSGGGGGAAPTATETVTAAPSQSSASASDGAAGSSASASAGASGSGSGSSGSESSGSGSSGSGSSGSASSGSAQGGRCAASVLRAGEEAGSGGAAGSTYVHITLTNRGSVTCTLQGWPGVSFVGGGDGEQIGNAAGLDRASAHPTVTLHPGQVAVAPLKITNAQNYEQADCSPVTPDGFRIYPPGSKQSLYVHDEGHTACRSTDVTLLQVQAFVAQGAAVD